MGAKMQLRSRSVEDEPRFVVGMDAHARKLAVSVWDWTDRLNPCPFGSYILSSPCLIP